MENEIETDDAKTAQAEANAAHVGTGLAIRDDGILVPSTPAILRLPNIRPYHGDPKWTLEQRLDWLAGRTVRGTEAAAKQLASLTENAAHKRAYTEAHAEQSDNSAAQQMAQSAISRLRAKA